MKCIKLEMFRNEKGTHICELRFRSVEFAWWHIDNARFQPKTSVYIKLDLATDFLRRYQRSARGQFISLRGGLSNEVTLTARQIQRQYIQLYSRSNSDRQLDAGHTSSEFNAFLGFICLVLNNWSSFLLLHTRQQQNNKTDTKQRIKSSIVGAATSI